MQHCSTIYCAATVQKEKHKIRKKNKNSVQNSSACNTATQFIVLQLYRKKNIKYSTVHKENYKNTLVTKSLYTACNTATHFHCVATVQKEKCKFHRILWHKTHTAGNATFITARSYIAGYFL